MVQYSTPGVLQDDLLRLAAGLRGALQGGGIGELDDGVDIPLVLFRQEAAGNLLAQEAGSQRHHREKDKADHRLADDGAATDADIAVGGAAEACG